MANKMTGTFETQNASTAQNLDELNHVHMLTQESLTLRTNSNYLS